MKRELVDYLIGKGGWTFVGPPVCAWRGTLEVYAN